ncbi:MAG TPA: hypothetical protein PJ982_14520, partial [Lacipirellulaceae bacterium]|nr:hypothetical protein [Lacipirellulaceae bacterium]
QRYELRLKVLTHNVMILLRIQLFYRAIPLLLLPKSPFEIMAELPSTTSLYLGLANAVHRILESYIGIHDNIFGVPWYRAIRRVLPIPGIFERIPYREHRDRLASLAEEMRAIRAQVELIAEIRPLRPAERSVCRSLQEYCEALLDSIIRLQAICAEMASKADGHPGPAWSEHQLTLDEYEVSCKQYVLVGERLNVALRTLKHEAR